MNAWLILLILLGNLALHPAVVGNWYAYRPAPGVLPPDGLVLAMIALLVAQSVLWACLWLRRKSPMPGLLAALALSIVALAGHAPWLETDWYRYLWDGIQVSRGISPYLNPPAILPWDEFAAIRAGINFPELATIYPMAAQWIFGLAALLSRADPFWFLVCLGAGGYIAVAAAGTRLAWRRGVEMQAVWLVLYHPLLLREWLQAAHYDSWMMALVLAGLASRQAWLRGVWLGISAQVKVISGVLLLPEGAQVGTWRQRLQVALGVGVAVGGLILSGAFLEGAGSLIQFAHSWRSFAGHWEMNAGPARWMRELWMALSGDYDLAREGSRLLMGGVFVAIAGWLAWIRRSALRAGQEVALTQEEITCALLFFATWLSPVFNTWYVTWSLILLPFLRPRWSVALAWAVVPVAFGDFFYLLGRTPFLPIERWWDIEHLWIIGALAWGFRPNKN